MEELGIQIESQRESHGGEARDLEIPEPFWLGMEKRNVLFLGLQSKGKVIWLLLGCSDLGGFHTLI